MNKRKNNQSFEKIKKYYPPIQWQEKIKNTKGINIFNELLNNYAKNDIVAKILKEDGNINILKRNELEDLSKSFAWDLRSLINKTNHQDNEKDLKKHNHIKKTLKEYQKFIKNNFEYVGDNFAYEARSIHYKNKKKEKGIYGTASKQDLEDLREEGIETKMIPWIEDNEN